MPKHGKYYAKWKGNMAKCSKYHATCKVTIPKCSKYHAKCKVTMPKCSKYHAKCNRVQGVRSSKLLQIQGKWYQQRTPKKIHNLSQQKIQKLFWSLIEILVQFWGSGGSVWWFQGWVAHESWIFLFRYSLAVTIVTFPTIFAWDSTWAYFYVVFVAASFTHSPSS